MGKQNNMKNKQTNYENRTNYNKKEKLYFFALEHPVICL